MCSLRDKKRFYLRLLLTRICEAISYEAICIINRILYNIFEEAIQQLGLLDEENNEFDKCLEEAATYQIPSKLRQLFASILLFCDPKEFNTFELLKNHINNLDKDYEQQQE